MSTIKPKDGTPHPSGGGTMVAANGMAPEFPVPFFLPEGDEDHSNRGARAPFLGRTVAVIDDLNCDERLYLYQHARRLKAAVNAEDQATIDAYRVADPDFGLYEVFLEDSTRTRESFKNAAHFHRLKFSEMNAATSSFNKAESYADTFANLIGYRNRIFVVRSKLEGVCRHLQRKTERYLRRHGIAWPVSFINAGDGRHEHPTQELLDEFTFLEDLDWRTDEIHLALVGDLYHGRTVHSKVHGLGLFRTVRVDLIAPPELSMPRHYVAQMRAQGFIVREFASIEEYLSHGAGSPDIAPQWYFTRPQLERMGERIAQRGDQLRAAVTFNPEHISRLRPGTVFYHPLPRHREHPTIPHALDDTALNGWERQSANGWVVRIVLLAMIAGRIGADYRGPVGPQRVAPRECHTDVPTARTGPKQYAEGIRPISQGLVIDHICVGESPATIRSYLTTLIAVMGLHGGGGEWISTAADGRAKGILFRPNHPAPNEAMLRKLAAVVPGATVNVIAAGQVQRKVRLSAPDWIGDLPELICRNEACITHPANGEAVLPTFRREQENAYCCEYCSTQHTFREIWK